MDSRALWISIAVGLGLAIAALAYGTYQLLGVPGLAIWFVLVCLVLMLVILIQKPKGGGLSGAFGGASGGSAQAAFGAKTGDVLTWFTVGCFVLFLGLAMGLQLTIRPAHQQLLQEPAPDTAAEEALDLATQGIATGAADAPTADDSPAESEEAALPITDQPVEAETAAPPADPLPAEQPADTPENPAAPADAAVE